MSDTNQFARLWGHNSPAYLTLETHPLMQPAYDGGPTHLPELSRLTEGRVRRTATGYAADVGRGSTLVTLGEYATHDAAESVARNTIMGTRQRLVDYVDAFRQVYPAAHVELAAAAADIAASPMSIGESS